MATAKEVRTLSAPAVFIDGRRIKVIPNSCTAELPGEVQTRAVSAGGAAYDIVHGVDVEAFTCVVKFDVALTGEMVEFVEDMKAKALNVDVSTVELVEKTAQLVYDRMLLTNKVEMEFAAEGSVSLEFTGRYAGI